MLVSSPSLLPAWAKDQVFDFTQEPLVTFVRPVKKRERKFEVELTDGGRRAAQMKERADCAVRAIALVTGMPYETAHALLKGVCGRRDRRATSTMRWYNMLDRHYTRLEGVKGKTLNAVIPTLDKSKTYIVSKRGHSLAVISGVVHDSFEPRPMSRVRAIWEVLPNQIYYQDRKW